MYVIHPVGLIQVVTAGLVSVGKRVSARVMEGVGSNLIGVSTSLVGVGVNVSPKVGVVF